MDPSLYNLPYQIPGPAGGPLSQFPTPLSQSVKPRSPSRHFLTAPWRAILHHLHAPPHGELSLTSSIALLRSHALNDRFQRLSKLPVLLDSLSWVGRDASVTLRDPTGTIRATIHSQVFQAHKKGIEIGAVLLLDGVAAVAYLEKRPAGFRTDDGESLHVSIQPCHVARVFPLACEAVQFSVAKYDPRESYIDAVRKPPIIRRPPSRRPPPIVVSPNPRPPLRQRFEPQHRKRSGFANSGPYRGGFQPRGQQRRPLPATHGHYNPPAKRPYEAQNTAQGGSGNASGPARRVGMQPVRRVGMQPLAKRPTPPREMASVGQTALQEPVNMASESGGDTLTDEQLDTLLGDVDVDAMIAASRRPASNGNVDTRFGGSGDASVGGHQVGENVPSEVGEQGAQGVGTAQELEMPIVHEGVTPGISALEEGQPTDSGVNAETKSAPADNAALEADTRILSKEDAAMIDSLLEGLDGSDFQ